jgi:hypothetical protein
MLSIQACRTRLEKIRSKLQKKEQVMKSDDSLIRQARKKKYLLWNLIGFTILVVIGLSMNITIAAADTTLLSADFNVDEDGFSYQDDAFGTSQPAYADGARTGSGGFGGTGGLQVDLGGIDNTSISGMSGGWQISLDLDSAQSGVTLSFRYRIEQSAAYEFDEYTQVLVKFGGAQYGRGSKSYVDQVGGDGSSSQGESSSYLPTSEWQQVEIFLGDFPADSYALVIGTYNNKKDSSDETTTLIIDDVLITSGNPIPTPSDAQTLVDRLDITQFEAYNDGVADFNDRCRLSGCDPSDYNNALDWVEGELQGMGYATVRHTYTSNGGGTNLWATKQGAATPSEMYIISAHLDGRGGGDAYDDDGSGIALLLEAARVFAGTDVDTDKSVRFLFFDREEAGLYGSKAYVEDRRPLQGTVDEPTWLGIIQHDMILYDHGAGSPASSQSAYADLDVEWRAGTDAETASKDLAMLWRFMNGEFSTDYPANAYNYSTNTDDTPFHPYTASVSVRENRRSLTSGGNAEWINPNYHTANDIKSSYSLDDIRLGFNAVQATVGTIAELAVVQLSVPNTPPIADPQSVFTGAETSVPITLTGSDADGDPITFHVLSDPEHGSLSGSAPDLIYTPDGGYTGPDSFDFRVNDGMADSAPAAVSIQVHASVYELPFFDDFETDKGWMVNPSGTDSATRGAWERAVPQATDFQGPKQLGTPVSGAMDLVTGANAGANAGSFDVDGGVTTIRSPLINLPSGQDITLSFSYYFAHARNATIEDFLKVKVIGSSMSTTVLSASGNLSDQDAAWQAFSGALNRFAGESIYLEIQVADRSRPSLVEAAIDDLSITASDASTTILEAGFDSGTDGFTYQDDTFRGTSQPGYANGAYAPGGGYTGGGLQVTLGGLDNLIINGISGGWGYTFNLASPKQVTVSFRYRLTQSPDYDAQEYSQALFSMDGVLSGTPPNDFLTQITGNGNGGIPETSGWQTFSIELGMLSAGDHTLVIGGYNNRKSKTNEMTEVFLDDVIISAK